MIFQSGLKPYTEAEREADAEPRRAKRKVDTERRKACPSGQRYDVPATQKSIELHRRKIGEPAMSE
jgi:hypothetical protein